MSNMMDWAKNELKLWNVDVDDDGFSKMASNNVLEVLDVLCNQGHSGMSAPIIMSIIQRLWSWKPLTPLTGEEDEWIEVGYGQCQNKRCHSVFKDRDTGKAHYLDGRVFVEPDGSTFTCALSSIDIDFPFTVPDKPIYVYLKYSTDEMDVYEQWKIGAYSRKSFTKVK